MILKIIYYNKIVNYFFIIIKMKNLLKFLLIFILLWINYSFATINLTVSPIKYEINTNTWATITKSALLHNRWNTTLKIITWKTDFVASGTDWSPNLVRYSELVHPDQQLSSWISLSSSWFTIPPKSKKEISFTIKIPENTTPGWHYWAVCFKNNNSEKSSSSWTSVWINVDYCVLILVKVNWKIVTDLKIDDNNIKIIHSWGWYSKIKKNQKNYNLEKNNSWNSYISKIKKDNCLVDFTDSNYDWKCFDDIKNVNDIINLALNKEKIKKTDKEKNDINDTKNNNSWNNKKENNKQKKEKNKFDIWFKIPVENKWNTHVKLKWKIKLYDENWKQIKQIWKKIIINKHWAIVWEKIVDYIPVNDNRWNILPWTKRIFDPEWKGFPYKEYSQELWKEIIKYKTPWEFYSDESAKKEFRLMPWEKVCYDKQNKKITAKFDLSYLNEEWKEVSFPSAKEFNIEYTRKYIWYNYYFIFWVAFIFIILLILFWLIWLLRKKKCINPNCKKRIKRNLKICPYCATIQEKIKEKSNKKKKKSKKKK